jgi:hypothetical protein
MRGVAEVTSGGRGRWRARGAAGLFLVAACCGSGPCLAQEPDPDILQLAQLVVAGPRDETTLGRLSLSMRAPLPGTSSGAAFAADIGLRWRAPLASQQVDITAWHRMGLPGDALSMVQQRDPTFGARLEFQLPKPRSGFSSELRAIGMQLDNGVRIGVRRTNGNPTLYFRQEF